MALHVPEILLPAHGSGTALHAPELLLPTHSSGTALHAPELLLPAHGSGTALLAPELLLPAHVFPIALLLYAGKLGFQPVVEPSCEPPDPAESGRRSILLSAGLWISISGNQMCKYIR